MRRAKYLTTYLARCQDNVRRLICPQDGSGVCSLSIASSFAQGRENTMGGSKMFGFQAAISSNSIAHAENIATTGFRNGDKLDQ